MATARALHARRPRRIVVLEAEEQLAAHQTGRNSGVIHSGLYYKPGSLKARLCRAGLEQMYRFCEEHDVRTERCGKIVVATKESELPALAELERRGKENGVGTVRCTAEELREHEPHVAGVAGLFVPETGIVRYASVLEAMAKDLERHGNEVRRGARVLSVKASDGGFVLETPKGIVRAKALVNCAGLQSDRVARMCGLSPALQIIPFRGEYYDLIESRRGLCKNLIYPVPDARFPFLGVHYTRATDGQVECGPNAVLAFRREGYKFWDMSLTDLGDMTSFLGFWNLCTKHARTGAFELHRSLRKSVFVRSLQALIPEITASDVVPGRAGVRAQAVLPDGSMVDDFFLMAAPGQLHVLNAPSPAATASLAIGQELALRADEVFR